jgi:hypothetical protein
MSSAIIVWDIETVRDFRGYAAANGMYAATDDFGAAPVSPASMTHR